jgi:hypothetical protein
MPPMPPMPRLLPKPTPDMAGRVKTPKPPREVAELGRPETPEETTARKAQNSRLYRERKTVNNLIYSLLATLGVVAVIFFAVPRPDTPQNWEVDYAAVGVTAQASVNGPLITPLMPSAWRANVAKLDRIDELPLWTVNFLTPTGEYITYQQVFGEDESGLRRILNERVPTGELTLGAGQTWTIFATNSATESTDPKNYALATFAFDDAFILTGSGSVAEFTTVATALTASLEKVAP